MKIAETFTSSLHVRVRYYIYQPKVVLRIKGIVQIYHGRGEHADMYEHFARYLLDNGFVVVVSDIVGHGQSLLDFEQGYFGDEKGIDFLIKDMEKLQRIIRSRFDEAPFFMLGVDLGSLLVRKYMNQHGDYVEGALLLGTLAKIKYSWIKKLYFNLMSLLKSPTYKKPTYRSLFHRGHNIKSDHWYSDDEEANVDYLNDPMRNFIYTTQGYRDMLSVIDDVNGEVAMQQTPKYISLYMGCGKNDKLASGIDKLAQKYKNLGIQDFTYHIFENCGHTLIFDNSKKDVYKDILKWLNERTYL